MTVGQLKKLIAEVPDHVELFRIGGDHEAFPVRAYDAFVTEDRDTGNMFEFFGEDFLLKDEKKTRAIIVE